MNEIEYRKELLSKARSGYKLDSKEREWLTTHKAFSDTYGQPFLQMDILELEPNCSYEIRAALVSSNCLEIIEPIVTVPMNKGEFSANDGRGGLVRVKALSRALDRNREELNFTFKSKHGLLCIKYHYLAIDHRGAEYWLSSTIDSNLAMKRQDISDNRIRYCCLGASNPETEHFDFELSWVRI